MIRSRVAGSTVLLRHFGSCLLFSSTSAAAARSFTRDPASFGRATPATLGRIFPARTVSSAPAQAAIGGEDDDSTKREASKAANPPGSRQLTSYWGVSPPKLFREDGTEWRWSCFRQPWDTYRADLTIDLKKHHLPTTFLDKLAYWTVKLLRVPTDIFFQRRYGCRAMMLETVAAVPGMVGGMLLHLRSLRRFEHSGGWIRALLEEAENERMHLMTFMEVSQPRWYERALVMAVQGVFFNAYFLGYLISPKFAHRVVGYLEEEAIHSYTEFLKDLDDGKIENIAAPAIAIDYWRLPHGATLRDVVMVVRADEAHHRDVNHYASVCANCLHLIARSLCMMPLSSNSTSQFKFRDRRVNICYAEHTHK
ncbi:Ubiquinol oxidase 1a, mitochondrial [Apostasia shenzhenica]|uniref:Ubiquinol oxidase n=1 Tax=Apostasia shenzhenica TaxID=1088818 RepID=A0A2I0BBR8_9ASPA|nr:Ubiquinol oxidase 1a, mitochondrial [Apostasia shenzhenica]